MKKKIMNDGRLSKSDEEDVRQMMMMEDVYSVLNNHHATVSMALLTGENLYVSSFSDMCGQLNDREYRQLVENVLEHTRIRLHEVRKVMKPSGRTDN